MTRYLLDTNHVSAIFKQHAGLIAEMSRQQGEYGVCLPSVGELWFMVFNSQRIRRNTQDLERVLADFRLWPFDGEAATEFGRIKAELRKSGRPIPDVDAQIPAIARSNDMVLLSTDSHFPHVSGLKVENWLGT